MPWSFIEVELLLPGFMLVLCRVSGIVITSPLYGSTLIPARVKISLVLVISTMIFPLLAPSLPQDLSLATVVAGMAGELLIGLLIGMGLNLILLSTQLAGMIVSRQAGLALANAFDPTTETQSSIIGQIYFFTAITLFLIIGGHRATMIVLLDTFNTVPVMTFRAQPPLALLIGELLMNSLKLALRLSAPMVIALLLAKMSLGFLSRTMPQLHILSVGFAIFVCLGMFLSSLGMSNLNEIMGPYIADAFDQLRALFTIFEPGG